MTQTETAVTPPPLELSPVHGEGPLVTVIVPTRNRCDLLKRSLGSVLTQTHRALEVIVVDDGSTDETRSCVDRIRRGDDRVRYIRNETSIGGAAARNVGLRAARGRYTAFLDDDDEWLPEKVRRQLPLAEKYSIVGCLSDRDRQLRKKPHRGDLTEITLNDVFYNNGRLSPSVMLTRTDRLREIGGYDETLVASQGRDLFIRLVEGFGDAVLIEEPLARHYQGHGQDRITDSPNHLIGGWQDFHKHASKMPRRLRNWRRFTLCLKEVQRAEALGPRLRWLLSAAAAANPLRPAAHAKHAFVILVLPGLSRCFHR